MIIQCRLLVISTGTCPPQAFITTNSILMIIVINITTIIVIMITITIIVIIIIIIVTIILGMYLFSAAGCIDIITMNHSPAANGDWQRNTI